MKVFKSFYSHSKRSIYLFLILGLITNCSSSEKGPKPNAMLRNFGITEKDASPRAIELNSGEFIDKPPEYDVLTRLCTKGKPRVNKTQTLSVRLPDPGNVPLDQASKFRREYLEKAEYLAKHFFNLASSRNPPPPYVPDGRFGPYDVEHKPWVNNSEYFNSDDRHLRSNMAFHAILGGQYWELPLVYLMMGKLI